MRWRWSDRGTVYGAVAPAMAEGALARGDEDMAHELIAVERALGGALRRLRRFAQG